MKDAAILRSEHLSAAPSWFDRTVPIVITRHYTGGDPFDNGEYKDKYGEIHEERTAVLNRLTGIAEHLFAAQHRVFLFMLLLIGRRFRLVRWDLARVITTSSVDYFDSSSTICDILWRLSLLDATAVRFDQSATRVQLGDVDYLRMDLAAAKSPAEIDHEDFLVGKPMFRAGGTTGRNTRGYVALDCETWDALRRLNEAGIENVPTLICPGNVCGQTTVTTEWWERKNLPSNQSSYPWSDPASHPSSLTLAGSASISKRKRPEDVANVAAPSQPGGRRAPNTPTHSNFPLRQDKHYRKVVEEVALPLKNIRNWPPLSWTLFEPITKRLRIPRLDFYIVKRDSDGTNPAIVWTGLLVDWELSKSIDDDQAPSKASQAERMGTYQFMSVNILTNPLTPVQVSDELESFFHVLLYYSLRYLRSNCKCPTSYIEKYFENYAGPGRLHTCGWKSWAIEVDYFLSNQYPACPLLFDSTMYEILGTIMKCFQVLYKVRKANGRKTRPPPLPPKLPPPKPPARIPVIRFFGDDAKLARAKMPAPPPVDDTPTSEDRERAKKVTDHQFMIEHITKTLSSSEWPDDDCAPPPAVKTQTSVSGSHGQSASTRTSRPTYVSNKRRRIAGPERHVSLPARLHASTRRTRVKPCTLPVSAASYDSYSLGYA
ncbi:hypothetical protein DICSQDRAFT_170783 [Dichomitus squalens LYAD-421 SS1]|uniref:Fungal-type protein kinase domain-containing protein n=1 Tax=Dichomitus squalens (strain LYAD-421) TaxID=732165 RepID=R7SXV7_DICSQ|nr:uncharacterized protein DICSQDRAFT_170783 [Dichomitus squalens LYAD-421 SS1]EJF60926.1 hypothetical protein DICSQDRAFT_170783 [Dichomitus squalens LYAD-421 SS1]